jgi:hypothetical protein
VRATQPGHERVGRRICLHVGTGERRELRRVALQLGREPLGALRPGLGREGIAYPKGSGGEQTCRAVVTATARLLERAGYEALTTNHVAERAGVGIASV